MSDEQDKEIGALRLDVGLMKKDILIVNEVYRKLDITIDKMQDLTAAISKMLTMHEHRLQYHEKKDDDLDRMIEVRRVELLSDIKELHLRVDDVEKSIMKELQDLKDFIASRRLAESGTQEVPKSLKERLASVEKWQWLVMGAIGAVTLIISNINLSNVDYLFR